MENEELVEALKSIAVSLGQIAHLSPILVGIQNALQESNKIAKQKKKCFIVRLFNTLKAKFK